ncbi:MAG: guanylate kinase [Lachnospiraceae bacterium]|nr:guanylate kinase [Lachnospiraceae bacterium]
MGKRGILTVISGFSGAGKGTLMKAILEKYDYGLSISATTRAPREGEVNGREYYFLSKQEFEDMIANQALIEWAQYVDNYYGTPKKYVEEQLAAGKNVILEIEIQGALHVKELFPDALLIFVTPPSAMDLKNRLVGRGTEDMATIEKRLKRAYEESAYMDQYDYIAINDVLEDCVEDLNQVITQAATILEAGGKFAVEQDFTQLISKIQKELKEL